MFKAWVVLILAMTTSLIATAKPNEQMKNQTRLAGLFCVGTGIWREGFEVFHLFRVDTQTYLMKGDQRLETLAPTLDACNATHLKYGSSLSNRFADLF